jgi:hypothetical protein
MGGITVGGNWFVQVLAKNIAGKLPLPWDAKTRVKQIFAPFLNWKDAVAKLREPQGL